KGTEMLPYDLFGSVPLDALSTQVPADYASSDVKGADCVLGHTRDKVPIHIWIIWRQRWMTVRLLEARFQATFVRFTHAPDNCGTAVQQNTGGSPFASGWRLARRAFAPLRPRNDAVTLRNGEC